MLWRIFGIFSVFYVPYETLTAIVPYPVNQFLNRSVQNAKTDTAVMTMFTDQLVN